MADFHEFRGDLPVRADDSVAAEGTAVRELVIISSVSHDKDGIAVGVEPGSLLYEALIHPVPDASSDKNV